jgi:hypothetical protein
MCRIRLPPGLKRWRTGSPGPSAVEAARGAVPLKCAKPPSVNRAWVADLDQQIRDRAGTKAAELPSVEPLERTSA